MKKNQCKAKQRKMSARQKLFVRASAFFFILLLFAAFVFEAVHAGHEDFCHEENCPVCLALQIIKSGAGDFCAPVRSNISLPFAFEIFAVILLAFYFVLPTPVSKKIKLVI